MQGNRASEDEQVKSVLIEDDGRFPNNGDLPLLLYPGAMTVGAAASRKRPSGETSGGPTVPAERSDEALAFAIEGTFHRNGWSGSWRNGIYGVHHYHSTAHEALGVYSGSARVKLGGESGPEFEIRAGDVVVIPAGVAHKRTASSADFAVVGAYPDGQRPDMCYGSDEERPRAETNIRRVSFPRKDPVYGDGGPLLDEWKRRGQGGGVPS
jgi:uncharacterized protein YjlB